MTTEFGFSVDIPFHKNIMWFNFHCIILCPKLPSKSSRADCSRNSNGLKFSFKIKFLAATKDVNISFLFTSNPNPVSTECNFDLDSFVVLVTNLILNFPLFRSLWKIENVCLHAGGYRSSQVYSIYLSKASRAPGIASLSTCRVPLRSIRTTFSLFII